MRQSGIRQYSLTTRRWRASNSESERDFSGSMGFTLFSKLEALSVERLEEFCLLTRREVLEQAGGFAEGPGLVPEELCQHIRGAGYLLLAARDVVVRHPGRRPLLPAGPHASACRGRRRPRRRR